MGFEEATPIQEQAIPIVNDRKDLIACAQTGTGKTAAFLLPIINKILSGEQKSGSINTLIIAPTRELALQIDQQIEALAYFAPVTSAPVYGGGDGKDFSQQRNALKKGADIIVATPGKLMAHMNLGYVDFSSLEHLVLDEADRMLDMGFFDDIISIVRNLPDDRQTLLFSATMPGKIRKLASNILHDPESISIALSKPAEGVLQAAYMVYPNQKVALLAELLKDKEERYPSIIIFSSTKRNVDIIVKELRAKGFKASGISSDLEQKEREEVLRKFAARRIQIIVGTDVIARGIDIKDVSLVVNFDVPRDAEDYVHRVGRTARADTTGVALTLITQREQRKFQQIEELIDREIPKLALPPSLGDGPSYEPNKRSSSGGGKRKGGRHGRHRKKGRSNRSKK